MKNFRNFWVTDQTFQPLASSRISMTEKRKKYHCAALCGILKKNEIGVTGDGESSG